jgi:hypothetical protein
VQRRSGFRPSRRNVLGAASVIIGPIRTKLPQEFPAERLLHFR